MKNKFILIIIFSIYIITGCNNVSNHWKNLMIEQKRKACKCLEENERILTSYDLLNENKTYPDSCNIYLERNYFQFLGEERLSEDEFNQLDKEIQEIINKPCN